VERVNGQVDVLYIFFMFFCVGFAGSVVETPQLSNDTADGKNAG
jgi:hypothetical protein